MLPSSVQADTMYSYAGNTFTTCQGYGYMSGAGSCQGAVTLSFLTALTDSQLDNLTNVNITFTVLQFIAYDGVGAGGAIHCGAPVPGACENSEIEGFTATITTSSTGDITAWSITSNNINNGAAVNTVLSSSSSLGDASDSVGGVGLGPCEGPQLDQIGCDGGGSTSVPGTWSGPTPAPEPQEEWLLLGIGLVPLIIIGLREKRISA